MMASPVTQVSHIPVEMPNRPGRRIIPRRLTIHETANPSVGADAEMHRRYVWSGGGPQLTSYNYVVDDHATIELLPIGESSNHAGTAEGNLSGISMELCVNVDGDWQRTQERAVDLIVWLFQTVPTLTPVASLVNHSHWRSDTACPARLRANGSAGWDALVRSVEAALAVTSDEDAELEARYQAVAGCVGAKRYAAMLTRDYYTGRLLVCDRGVVTQTGQDIMGNLMDDWADLGFGSSTLRRL